MLNENPSTRLISWGSFFFACEGPIFTSAKIRCGRKFFSSTQKRPDNRQFFPKICPSIGRVNKCMTDETAEFCPLYGKF